MARVSKYQNFEGQSFNIKGLDVQVVRYHREVRTSQKTGKKYYAYRLDVQMVGYSNILEISTTSWKNESFIKRLQKISVNKVYTNVYNYLPVVYNPIRKNFLGETDEQSFDWIFKELEKCENSKELRKTYKKMAKNYHPDSLGRELFPDEQIVFNELKRYKDIMLEFIKELEEAFGMKLGWFR